MSDVFLSQLQLLNFRTFGKFSLDVAPVPGLILLVGTNGLGKSSFFDAIEWGLTGRVRRFESYLTSSLSEGDYLTRRDAPPNSHQVDLRFTDGKPLIRNATRAPGAAEVIALLKKPEWGTQIQDISTYLAFTHFLGQAAQQRFTSRNRGEQWESLKGPSGIDRLEEVRHALRGRTTQAAFRRRLEQQSSKVEATAARLATWQTSRLRLQKLREAAMAAGVVLEGADLAARIGALSAKLADIAGRESAAGQVTAATASVRLIALRDEIAAARTALSARLSALESLTDLPSRHTTARALASPESALIASARRILEESQSVLSTASQSLREVQSAVRQQTSAVTRLQAEVSLLTAVREDLERMTEIARRLTDVAGATSAVEIDLASRQAQRGQIELTLEGGRSQRSQLAELERAWDKAKADLNLCRQLVEMQGVAAAAKAAAGMAVKAAAEARARETVLTEERDSLASALSTADQQLKEARTRATEMAAAVARIASHLGPHDDHCPICATPFAPQDLKLLAEQAAVGQSAGLASAEAAYAESSFAHGRALHELAAVMAAVSAAQVAEREAAAASATADAMREQVRLTLGISPDEDPAILAVTREAAAAAAMVSFQLTIKAAEGALREAADRRLTLTTEVSDIQSRLSELAEQRAALERDQRAARERLGARGRSDTSAGVLANDLAAQNRLLIQAQAALQEAEAKAVAAASAETIARERVETAQIELTRQLAVAEAAGRDAASLEAQWTAAGLAGSPMASALAQSRATLATRLDELQRLAKDQADLARSNEAVLLHQEITDLVRVMDAEGGQGAAEKPDIHEAKLQTDLEEAKATLRLSESARVAIYALADRLKEAARDFSTQFLVPLNDLIDDFNEALLSSPGESIRFSAAHHVDSTRFDMRLRFRDQLDEALYNTDLPPQIVLSEGQLAANGFSILCAASTAYPWSRWRALLLDDPLQHNDIIHAAAFVDVMRNLVELERYQIVMSSHDRAEGEFIARKFDAAELPCTVVTLAAPSATGVKYEPPRHNRTALAHLREALARSG